MRQEESAKVRDSFDETDDLTDPLVLEFPLLIELITPPSSPFLTFPVDSFNPVKPTFGVTEVAAFVGGLDACVDIRAPFGR